MLPKSRPGQGFRFAGGQRRGLPPGRITPTAPRPTQPRVLAALPCAAPTRPAHSVSGFWIRQFGDFQRGRSKLRLYHSTMVNLCSRQADQAKGRQCLLHQSGLPLRYWTLAARAFCHGRNVSLAAFHGETPWKAKHGGRVVSGRTAGWRGGVSRTVRQ